MILYGALIFALAIVALSVLLKVPGLELILRPVIQGITKIIEFILVKIFFSWLMYLLGELWRAHKTVISHFVHDEEYYDLRLKVDRLNRRG